MEEDRATDMARLLRWWERWLRTDSRRSTAAVVLAVLVTAPVVTLWLARDTSLRPFGWTIGALVVWTVFGGVHSALTFAVCNRMSLAELGESTQRLTEETGPAAAENSGGRVLALASRELHRRGRAWNRWSTRQHDAPSWFGHVSVLALIVVAVILVTPTLRASQAVLFAALAMVAMSWINVLVVYTVHYARLDSRAPGLGFPGEEPQELADYLYLALAVQTTFGTTDVEVRTRALRRVASVHGALAFVFNSVILAMIVSLLLGVGR